jgi:hypothetical protein
MYLKDFANILDYSITRFLSLAHRTIVHDALSGLPKFTHTRLEPWLQCHGNKAPSTGLVVYETCLLDIGDLSLNIDLKYILADVISFSGKIMPELNDMLGYVNICI